MTKQYFPIITKSESYYQYQNLNKDKNLRNHMVKKYTKHLEKWIDNNFYDKLNILIKFRKSNKNIKEYIFKNYLTYEKIYSILRKYVNRNDVNWYDLHEHKYELRKYFTKKIKKFLEN